MYVEQKLSLKFRKKSLRNSRTDIIVINNIKNTPYNRAKQDINESMFICYV